MNPARAGGGERWSLEKQTSSHATSRFSCWSSCLSGCETWKNIQNSSSHLSTSLDSSPCLKKASWTALALLLPAALVCSGSVGIVTGRSRAAAGWRGVKSVCRAVITSDICFVFYQTGVNWNTTECRFQPLKLNGRPSILFLLWPPPNPYSLIKPSV